MVYRTIVFAGLVSTGCSTRVDGDPSLAQPCTLTGDTCSPIRCYVVEGYRHDPDRNCVLADPEPIGYSDQTLVAAVNTCWATADGVAYALLNGHAPVGGLPLAPCPDDLRARVLPIETCAPDAGAD